MSEQDDLAEQAYHAPHVPQGSLFSNEELEAIGKALDKTFKPTKADLSWEEYAKAEGLVWDMPNSSERRAFMAAWPTEAGLSTTGQNGMETSEVVQELIHSAETGLNFMLRLQSDIESVWGRKVDPDDPEAVSRYIREVVLCATDELHEVLGEVHWKPWKNKRGIQNMEKYREEMADVLHFILDLYLAAGLSGRDIILDYLSKHYENLERNRSAEYRES